MFKPLILLLIIFVNVSIAKKKTNILWIIIELTSPHFIGCYVENGEIKLQMRKDLFEKPYVKRVAFMDVWEVWDWCRITRTTEYKYLLILNNTPNL